MLSPAWSQSDGGRASGKPSKSPRAAAATPRRQFRYAGFECVAWPGKAPGQGSDVWPARHFRKTSAPSASVEPSGNSRRAHQSAGIGCRMPITSSAGPHHQAGAGDLSCSGTARHLANSRYRAFELDICGRMHRISLKAPMIHVFRCEPTRAGRLLPAMLPMQGDVGAGLVEVHMLVDAIDPGHRDEVMVLAVGRTLLVSLIWSVPSRRSTFPTVFRSDDITSICALISEVSAMARLPRKG